MFRKKKLLCQKGNVSKGVDIEDLLELPVNDKIGRAKYIKETELDKFDEIEQELRKEIADLVDEGVN